MNSSLDKIEHVLFRVDANKTIGLGHLSRCLVLAQHLIKTGYQVTFASMESEEVMKANIESYGITLALLPPIAHTHDVDFEEADANNVVILFNRYLFSWVVVDQNQLSFVWQNKIKSLTTYLLVIDDQENNRHDCDILVNYNPRSSYQDRYSVLVNSRTQCLLGPKYALINQAFLSGAAREKAKRQIKLNPQINVGLFFGSFPVEKILPFLKSLEAKLTELPHISFTLVHRDVDLFSTFIEHKNVTGTCYVAMQDFINKIDIAIGTSGVAALERVANICPSINLLTEGHAHLGIKALADKGCCSLVDLNKGPNLYQSLIELMSTEVYKKQLKACKDLSRSIEGSAAIVNKMQELSL